MKLSNIQILILRLALAALFLSIGLDKYREGWLTNAEPLTTSLNNYHQHASGPQLTYLDSVAIPYAHDWSVLMTIGELAIAVSFFLGLLTRFASAVAIIMVLNFHAANGNLFSWNFFGSPWAGLLIAGLLTVFLSRAGRWAGIDGLLARSNSKGILW